MTKFDKNFKIIKLMLESGYLPKDDSKIKIFELAFKYEENNLIECLLATVNSDFICEYITTIFKMAVNSYNYEIVKLILEMYNEDNIIDKNILDNIFNNAINELK